VSPAPGALLDDDAREFFAGPVSVILGTADRLNTPDATRVVGIAPITDRRARVLISSEAREAHANAALGARASVLVTDITNYRSLQWKGRVVQACEPRTPGDLALMHRHIDTFAAAAPTVGISPRVIDRLFPNDVVALEIEFDAKFDQTPGAGAGRRVA
jgi:hypothetical protein